MSILFRIIIIFYIIVCAGCNPMRSNLGKFDSYIEQGDISTAAEFSTLQVKGGENPSNDDVLWMLQAGTTNRLLKDYQLSNDYYNRAEDLIKFYREKSDKNVRNIWATATNDTALSYEGAIYDGIMLNTYKAINHMATGKNELARVEFNRANDRQRRAKEYYSTEIEKARQELKEEDQKAYDDANSEQNMAILNSSYPELKDFKPYPDFINPFTSYLAAIFFYLEGDLDKAEFLIKQSAGMVENNEYIIEDMNNIRNRLSVENVAWVIFENGLGPVKDEFRIDLPLFISTGKVQYFGIALPKLRTRDSKIPYLTINDGEKNYNTQHLVSMERIIKTEFAKQYPEILARAIVSATTKAVAQYALQESSGSTAAMMMALYSFATTTSDSRIWSSLPNEFQVARLKKPASGKLKITPASSSAQSIEIETGSGNSIIYIRMIGPATKPVYEVITF